MPAVAVCVTVPNVPALVPPDRVNWNALLASPLIGLSSASFTAMVRVSMLPEASVPLAGLIVDSVPLTGFGVTVMDGWTTRLTPLTVAVRLLGVRAAAVVPVKATV